MSITIPGQCMACDQPAVTVLSINVGAPGHSSIHIEGGVTARYPSCPKHVGQLAARMVNDTRRALAKLGQLADEHDGDHGDIIDVDSREPGQLDTAVYGKG